MARFTTKVEVEVAAEDKDKAITMLIDLLNSIGTRGGFYWEVNEAVVEVGE